MMSAKMATLGLLNIKVFWNKGYDVIVYVLDVKNQILLRDSNCIVDVVIWKKFGNLGIYMRMYHNFNVIKTWPEKPLFLRGVLEGSN